VKYSALSAEEVALTCFRGGDESDWSEFIQRFHSLIARVVTRVARKWGEDSPQVLDDLIQDTYLKLCADRKRLLQNFKPTHEDAIYGYIKVFTANLVHDHFRASRSAKRGGGTIPDPIENHEPPQSATWSTSSATNLDRTILIHEIDAFLRDVSVGPNSDRDKKIFWLYYRVGLAASAIAALPTIGLATKGVETTILRLTRLVRQRACKPKIAGSPGKTEGIQPEDSL
jgi:RNA polymerase sigma-70 factor (ECF subfamily)